jgi:hypothetical protein
MAVPIHWWLDVNVLVLNTVYRIGRAKLRHRLECHGLTDISKKKSKKIKICLLDLTSVVIDADRQESKLNALLLRCCLA